MHEWRWGGCAESRGEPQGAPDEGHRIGKGRVSFGVPGRAANGARVAA